MEKENENGTGERKVSLLTTASLVPSKEISLSIIAEELTKIRQIMEVDLKQKSQMTGKYSTMMRDFFAQKQEQ